MEKKKKKWERPVCERVKLEPAEAMALGCKFPGGKGTPKCLGSVRKPGS
jgi:hypothetical protein